MQHFLCFFARCLNIHLKEYKWLLCEYLITEKSLQNHQLLYTNSFTLNPFQSRVCVETKPELMTLFLCL